MARDSSGSKNQPQYAGTGAPADAADLSEIATYAALVGNRKVGSTAARTGSTGADVWEGLLWGDTDDGLEYRYTSGAWVAPTRRQILGEADRLASATAFTPTTSMSDVPGASVTCTTPARTVRVTCSAILVNAGSGVDRTANLQLLCDGVLIGEVLPNIYINYTATFPTGAQSVVMVAKHVPTAGSHVYKLQALASAAAAVQVNQVNLIVETAA
jgi:hypothetical protein